MIDRSIFPIRFSTRVQLVMSQQRTVLNRCSSTHRSTRRLIPRVIHRSLQIRHSELLGKSSADTTLYIRTTSESEITCRIFVAGRQPPVSLDRRLQHCPQIGNCQHFVRLTWTSPVDRGRWRIRQWPVVAIQPFTPSILPLSASIRTTIRKCRFPAMAAVQFTDRVPTRRCRRFPVDRASITIASGTRRRSRTGKAQEKPGRLLRTGRRLTMPWRFLVASAPTCRRESSCRRTTAPCPNRYQNAPTWTRAATRIRDTAAPAPPDRRVRRRLRGARARRYSVEAAGT